MIRLDVQRVADRLAGPLPGVAAQLDMAPVYRSDPAMASVLDKDCADAAVLVLLHPTREGDAVLFIRRPGHLVHHAGQIAFPGGRREADETLGNAALREAGEEVGLPASIVRVIGTLTPLYVPPSGFCVHPFVGHVETLPPLILQQDEVAGAFSVPIARLLDPSSRSEATRRVGGTEYLVPCFDVDGNQIWGATAMMLAELVAVVRDTVPASADG